MSKHWRKRLVGLGGIGATLGWSVPAHAHAFGQRYDLPVPLWLYLAGAGAAVALSFAAVGLFVRSNPGLHAYPRLNLLRWRGGRFLAHPFTLFVVKLFALGVFVLVILTGYLGNQNPIRNVTPTMVWIIWWVGLAFVSPLLGNLWALINPWKISFAWAEALYRRFRPGEKLSAHHSYPRWLGVWPGVILFVAFAWAELVWDGSVVPLKLSFAATVYSLITWFGMFLFGREQWLRNGEAFSVAFGILARFAPTEVRVRNPAVCQTCSSVEYGSTECGHKDEGCVNCYECFNRADESDREWNLRPPAVGLIRDGGVPLSMVVFVLLVLSTVTFDGFTETPPWVKIVFSFYNSFQWMGGYEGPLISTLGLVGFPVLFLGIYFIFCALMATASDNRLSTGKMASLFVFSLVPIAIAYHLSHNLSFLLVQGQGIIRIASDPFGFGWDLLGTAQYRINIGLIGARFIWFTSVIAIVLGHIISVYLAHVMALRAMRERKPALRSQYPMLVLMVIYTVVSLWILAQPIVETAPAG